MVINLKLMTLNVRGLNKEGKRRAIYRYVKSKNIDVCYLQETYSTKGVEQIWKNQWGGDIFYSHGTNHSKGAMILIRPGFNVEVKKMLSDCGGRFIFLHANIQGEGVQLLNIYSPTVESEQKEFYKRIQTLMHDEFVKDCAILVGGDMNLIIDPTIDRKGGNFTKTKVYNDIIELFKSMVDEFELCDIW